MFRYWLPAFSLHTTRALALTLTLTAAGTIVLFATDHPWLAEFDVWLEDRRFGGAHQALQQVLQPGVEPALAKVELERLRAEFTGYLHGDRQERIWAIATLMLARQDLAVGRNAAAARLAAELQQARPRELLFQFFYADCLRASGDTTSSDAVLADLLRRLPEHDEIARRSAQLAISGQQWLQAGAALARHLRKPPPLGFEATFQTLDQDPGLAPLQRALLFTRLDGAGELSTRFRAPAGATRIELQPPPGVRFELRNARFVGALPAVASQAPTGDTLYGPTAAGTRPPRPSLGFRAPLPAPLDLRFAATLTYRHADWLQAVLLSPAATAMITALSASGQAHAAAAIDRHRRLALLARQQTVTSIGPAGRAEHSCELRGGWPGTDRIDCAIAAVIGRQVRSLLVPWPAPANGADMQLPRVVTTPDNEAPRVRRDGDAIRFEWPTPRTIERAVFRGRLLP